jgi:H+/Cl- antiporter ClcA
MADPKKTAERRALTIVALVAIAAGFARWLMDGPQSDGAQLVSAILRTGVVSTAHWVVFVTIGLPSLVGTIWIGLRLWSSRGPTGPSDARRGMDEQYPMDWTQVKSRHVDRGDGTHGSADAAGRKKLRAGEPR